MLKEADSKSPSQLEYNAEYTSGIFLWRKRVALKKYIYCQNWWKVQTYVVLPMCSTCEQ